VAGYKSTWFACRNAVTHPNTNPAQRGVTYDVPNTTALPLYHAAVQISSNQTDFASCLSTLQQQNSVLDAKSHK